jgi:hypothetical protein
MQKIPNPEVATSSEVYQQLSAWSSMATNTSYEIQAFDLETLFFPPRESFFAE